MADHILLIDDNKEHASALKTYLERIQFEVTTTSEPKDILLHLSGAAWDIILGRTLDNDDIAQSFDEYSENHPLTRIIIYGPEPQLNRAMRRYGMKFTQYLSLPINSIALELALKSATKDIRLTKKINRYTQRLADLHDAQILYNQLFDQVPCYISVQDRNLRITATNKRFKEHFGHAIGGRCFEIYKHRSHPCSECPVIETFNDGRVHSTEEIVTSISGKQYNVLTHTAPIRDEKGQITQVMEMSTNITQIRHLQDHLTSLGLMLGSMSHGVKGMLTALDGGIYQLETGLKKEDSKRILSAFEQVKMVTDKIKKMVLEILYYAKSRQLQYVTLEVTTLADNIIRNIQPVALKNNVDMKVRMAQNLGEIEIDPSWMEAALINFLENAIDACSFDRNKTDHRVQFDISTDDKEHLCFTIADNGIGMDEDTRNKMFTLFFTSKGSQGTGLGLFIANRVINQHGGKVKVESIQNQGSTFRITLPRKRPENFKTNDFTPVKG